jgi:hypothetical protein
MIMNDRIEDRVALGVVLVLVTLFMAYLIASVARATFTLPCDDLAEVHLCEPTNSP